MGALDRAAQRWGEATVLRLDGEPDLVDPDLVAPELVDPPAGTYFGACFYCLIGQHHRCFRPVCWCQHDGPPVA